MIFNIFLLSLNYRNINYAYSYVLIDQHELKILFDININKATFCMFSVEHLKWREFLGNIAGGEEYVFGKLLFGNKQNDV
jgi:hypothetical protein